jgi:acyl-CoA synthetase (AMP-forming)/AMP-acid ligase II
LNPATLAFLQYTSGSTAEPKGVMLSHGNLMHNLDMTYHAFGIGPDSRVVIWLPPYHDMGLIGGILQPLYAGTPVILMSPLDFLQRPLRWLQAIARYQAAVSGGPNFAYDLCVRKSTPEQRAALDLSHWQKAFNGAEPIRAGTLTRFATAFAGSGFRPEAFYPCYGLAEATLIVSGGGKAKTPAVTTVQAAALAENHVVPVAAEAEDSLTFVSCGPALGRQEIAIVHPVALSRCPAGQVGEIWLSGPSVAQGYWQRPQDTARTFLAYTADTGEGPFLRTGDLGFLQGGELFVTGRLKDLIIIDGLNHYPQDIEVTVEQSHPLLRPGCSAAFAVNSNGREGVVVVVEVARPKQVAMLQESSAAGFTPDEIVKSVRRAVAQQHDLRLSEVVLLKAGTVPKTSSGKIQRHACRAGFLSGALEVWQG